MRVEDLYLTKDRVCEQYAGSRLAHEPVTSEDINW